MELECDSECEDWNDDRVKMRQKNREYEIIQYTYRMSEA